MKHLAIGVFAAALVAALRRQSIGWPRFRARMAAGGKMAAKPLSSERASVWNRAVTASPTRQSRPKNGRKPVRCDRFFITFWWTSGPMGHLGLRMRAAGPFRGILHLTRLSAGRLSAANFANAKGMFA